MNSVEVSPKLIDWACQRSGMRLADLEKRFPKLPQWRTGQRQPTFAKLEAFAKATLTPFGAFFLSEPPEEKLPFPDFRTMRDRPVRQLTAPLLETIYQMQRRQDWLRDYLSEIGSEPLDFVGSVTADADPLEVAVLIRSALGMTRGWAREHPTWGRALLGMRRAAENLRIMVVINGCVGNNTHKPLDPEEFRGFVLSDSVAPLIFINGADWKSAQMFTLAHELAHLWIGRGALFDLPHLLSSGHAVEQFCNRVAAEVLVPGEEMREAWRNLEGIADRFAALARQFKVSEIVAARRALDLGFISRADFMAFWNSRGALELKQKQDKEPGGDFYKSQGTRIGFLFGEMIVRAAREGKVLYQDAYRLTGLHGSTFDRFARELGMSPS